MLLFTVLYGVLCLIQLLSYHKFIFVLSTIKNTMLIMFERFML